MRTVWPILKRRKSWKPSAISGLAYEWTAETLLHLGDGANISAWADNLNGVELTQATTARQPVLEASLAAANNKPAVRFDDTDDNMATVNFPTALAQPNTVLMVLKTCVPQDTLAYYFAGGHLLRTNTGYAPDTYYLFAGSSWNDAGAATKDKFISLAAVFNGAASKMYEDGVLLGTGNAGTGSMTSMRIASSSYPLNGCITYIGVVNREISAAEVNLFAMWANKKYGL